MDKKQALLLCLLPMLIGACSSGTGHAHVRRNSGTLEETPPEPAPVQVVRPTYAARTLLPPREVPFYFCESQRSGVSKMNPVARADYEAFCRRATYPHTMDTWLNDAALSGKGPRKVVICLGAQRGVFMVDGQPVLDFPVCTGSTLRPTPTGRFEVLEKDRDHHSNLYDNASMQCFMRLTWDGVGMHIGPMAGHPASHGCIRLPAVACRRLYDCVPLGTPVEVLP